MKKLNVAAAVFSLVFAHEALASLNRGTEGGNGGDLCEKQVYDIRTDILSWINKGGAEGLKLDPITDLSTYVSRMSESLTSAKVSCVNETLKVGRAEKTCVNLDQGRGPRIICNLKRFSAVSDADKYVLLHHEYAGLAGLEKNDGEVSHYEISSQLTGFLEQKVIARLAVKPTMSNVTFPDSYLRDSFSETFLRILSKQILPMACDYSKIHKGLQVKDFLYSYEYSGDSGACIRKNPTDYPFYLRFVSLRLQTDYVFTGANNQTMGPRNIVKFSGKLSYPSDLKIQEEQVIEVARQFFGLVRDDVKADFRITNNPEGGFILKMEAAQDGVAFSLVIEVKYASEGLPSDSKKPIVTIFYEVFS